MHRPADATRIYVYDRDTRALLITRSRSATASLWVESRSPRFSSVRKVMMPWNACTVRLGSVIYMPPPRLVGVDWYDAAGVPTTIAVRAEHGGRRRCGPKIWDGTLK